MRQLQFLDGNEKTNFRYWSSSAYLAAADRLEWAAALVQVDKERFPETLLVLDDEIGSCARGVLTSIIRKYPYPSAPRDGRQIARKMRRAARRCRTLSARKGHAERVTLQGFTPHTNHTTRKELAA